MNTLQVLDASGHMTINWNPDSPEEVENITAIVDDLRKKGYRFFSVIERGITINPGALTFELVRNNEYPALPPAESRVPPEEKRRPGRPPSLTVAVKPMRGG